MIFVRKFRGKKAKKDGFQNGNHLLIYTISLYL